MIPGSRMTDWQPSELPKPAPRFKATGKRGYAAAQLTRWVDFQTSLEVAHKERQRDLAKLRGHSRDLTKNNVYARRFIDLVSTNVVGPEGIGFESEIIGYKNKPKEAWNDTIEAAFLEWSKACTVDGKLSRAEFEQLVAETVATDGECLVRKLLGFPNAHGFAVELIDADRLDHEFNTTLKDGRRVIMGVEVDVWGKPLAYHLWTEHPQDYEGGIRSRERVPAEQILHVYREDRARGTRGVPWAVASMVQLNMLGKLWTAELAAANWESNRLGVLQARAEAGSEVDAQAAAQEMSSEIATFMGIDDPDLEVIFPQIQHPNGVLPQFSLALLKGIAAGLGVSYHSLAADVSDANYSSARVALLEERDRWKKLQIWFIKSVSDPIFRAWLEMAILKGVLKIPALDYESLCAPVWWPRTWDWVDPTKDEAAATNAILHGLSTHQRELGRQGKDWREEFRQLKTEQDYATEIGLVLNLAPNPVQTAPAKPEDPKKEAADAPQA